MRAGLIFVCAALALAACASNPPVSRTESAPPAAAPAPAPTLAQPAPDPSLAAPNVSAPPAPAPRRPSGDIIVPGQVEQQVPAPRGDPRTESQRMEDIRNWDTCVMEVQRQGEANPTRPQLNQPEDYCAQALGQADRTAVPASRLEQRR